MGVLRRLERDWHSSTNFLVVCCIGPKTAKMNPGKRDESLQYASVSGSGEKETYGRSLEDRDWMFVVNEDFRKIVKCLALSFSEITQDNP